ncbi:WcaI family glycosyltransferase [Marinoscillum sp.]|uniref:WcaI family glycosyltransferase n=1 Tax=Marinoscillum sp. TaxID=2024838 RepID=UPI003BA84284
MEKRVIVYSYYSPEELTGIGKYNGEMIEWLKGQGLNVTSFSNAPFYPHWRKYEGYSNPWYRKVKNHIIDVRSWVYIPESPGALKKIISEVSFFVSSGVALLLNLRSVRRCDLFLVINPPFFLGLIPLIFSKLFRFKVQFHIQDLQIDAARELGLLPSWLCSFLESVELFILKRADFLSTISEGMKRKIEQKGITKDVILLPNWSDLRTIKPEPPSRWLHNAFGIEESKKLIVYSGNIGEKQGLEIVIEAARILQKEATLHFLVLGEGLYKKVLMRKIEECGLENVTLGNLVAKEKLNEMLNGSFLQLVIQKSEGADSFLPSKLTNILAAGCISIVTANPGTSLHDILTKSSAAIVIEPDSVRALSEAIGNVLSKPEMATEVRVKARNWAEANLAIDQCLSPILKIIT